MCHPLTRENVTKISSGDTTFCICHPFYLLFLSLVTLLRVTLGKVGRRVIGETMIMDTPMTQSEEFPPVTSVTSVTHQCPAAPSPSKPAGQECAEGARGG
jgi:hypothetical protein